MSSGSTTLSNTRAVEEQLVVLENEAELAAQERHRARLQRSDVLAVDDDAARRRPLDRDHQLEQRGLAGARMAGDERQLARVDVEAYVVQRLVAAWIALGDVAEEITGSGIED